MTPLRIIVPVLLALAVAGCTPDRQALETKAQGALTVGDARAAIEALDELIEHWPREASYHAWRAQALEQIGQTDAAVAELEEAMGLAPQDMDLASQRAMLLLRLGHNEAAARELRVVADRDPANIYARGWLAVALARKNTTNATAEATSISTSLLDHDPRNLGGLVALSIIRHQQGQLSEARELLSRAREQAPDDPIVGELVARIGVPRE